MTRLKSIAFVLAALGTVLWAAPAFLAAREGPPPGQPGPSPASKATSPATPPGLIDRHGDPLPPGASLRLGTVRFRQDRTINRITYSPDGKFVVTDLKEEAIQIWDAQDRRRLRRLDVGIETIRDFHFSPDGKIIASVGFQYDLEKRLPVHRVTFVDFVTGRQFARGEWDERGDVYRLSFSSDGKIVATSSDDGFRLWNAVTGEQLLVVSFKRTILLVNSLAFSPDGQFLAAGTFFRRDRGVIHIYRLKDKKEVQTIAAPCRLTLGLAFTPDGKRLVAGMADTSILIWDLAFDLK